MTGKAAAPAPASTIIRRMCVGPTSCRSTSIRSPESKNEHGPSSSGTSPRASTAWSIGPAGTSRSGTASNAPGSATPRPRRRPLKSRPKSGWRSIHGSRGLIYFVHQFKPNFNEHALLDDPEMLAAVTAMNQPDSRAGSRSQQPFDRKPGDGAFVGPERADRLPGQERADGVYLFAVGMRNRPMSRHILAPGASRHRELQLCSGKTGRSRFVPASSMTTFPRTECISIELPPVISTGGLHGRPPVRILAFRPVSDA